MTEEKFTEKDLETILNSKMFKRGLNEIIKITNETGCEAGFSWCKIIGEKFFYPGEISVGSEISLPPGGVEQRSYPCTKSENERIFSKIENGDPTYTILDVHTHPHLRYNMTSDSACPSDADFEGLNEKRWDANEEEDGTGLFLTLPEPIGMVIPIGKWEGGLYYFCLFNGGRGIKKHKVERKLVRGIYYSTRWRYNKIRWEYYNFENKIWNSMFMEDALELFTFECSYDLTKNAEEIDNIIDEVYEDKQISIEEVKKLEDKEDKSRIIRLR